MLAFHSESTRQALAQARPLLPRGKLNPQLQSRSAMGWNWNTTEAFLSDTDGASTSATRDAFNAVRASADPMKLRSDLEVPLRDVPDAISPGVDGEAAGVDDEPFLTGSVSRGVIASL